MDELNFGNGSRISYDSADLVGLDYEREVRTALKELNDHLVMDTVHEEEIGEYLTDNPEVVERPGLLIAAGAVPLHEMSKVEYDDYLAYSMGDTVVVEESGESGWERAASVPYEVAVVVAQARAQHRAGALMMDHDALRESASEEIQREINARLNSGDSDDDFYGTSPIASAAQRVKAIQENHAVNSMATPTTVTGTVDVDLNMDSEKINEIASKLSEGMEEEFSIGFGDK